MKKTLITALIAATPALLAASGATSVTGDYVEARTAEVFAGGCIQGSEGEAAGREAILAWRVAKGQVNGVAIDGLSIVAVVTSDQNLSMHEIGGDAPRAFRTAIRVDSRATAAQRDALVTLAKSLSGMGLPMALTLEASLT